MANSTNFVTNVKTTEPTEPLEHNEFFVNVQNLLKEHYELQKKFLAEEKKHFYNRGRVPIDYNRVLGR